MTMRRAIMVFATFSAAAVTLTCKDSPTEGGGAAAGWLAVEMTTPNNDDAGIMFIVAGGVVDSVRSTYPNVLSRNESASTVRVVVGGNLAAGKIAEVWVPDVRKAAQYTATPVEAAARGTFAQRSTTGYTLKLSRQP